MRSKVPSKARFLGWYVDGEWVVQNQDLTFLAYKPKGFVMTNNLVLRSSRSEFVFDFRLDIDAKAAKGKSDKKEVLVLGVSPMVFDINGFSDETTNVNLVGINYFFFRNEQNQGIVFAKEFAVQTSYDLRTVFAENHRDNPRYYCDFEVVNKDVKVNATIDFEMGSAYLTIDGKECMIVRAGTDVFPEDKATVYLTGISTKEAPAKLVLKEARVSKYVGPLPPEDYFQTSTVRMISSLAKHDPNYYTNTSLSNVLLMQVG